MRAVAGRRGLRPHRCGRRLTGSGGSPAHSPRLSVSTPAFFRPSSPDDGIEPIATSTWDSAMDRPSSHSTTTPSSSTRARLARAPFASDTPVARKSASSAAATSGSLFGSTCCRETIKVTCEPSDRNMCTNSTPVTPEPTTMRCSGISGGGYACRVRRMCLPSISAHSGIGGAIRSRRGSRRQKGSPLLHRR